MQGATAKFWRVNTALALNATAPLRYAPGRSGGEAESYLGGLRARQGRPVVSIAIATSATAIRKAMMVYRSNGLSMAPS